MQGNIVVFPSVVGSEPLQRTTSPDFGAYAPDPDADYDRGYRDGYRAATNEAKTVAWYGPRPGVTGRWTVIGLAAIALILAALGWRQ